MTTDDDLRARVTELEGAVTHWEDQYRRQVDGLAQATAEIERLTAEVARARSVLRTVEWDHQRRCALCRQWRPKHHPDCDLVAALRAGAT